MPGPKVRWSFVMRSPSSSKFQLVIFASPPHSYISSWRAPIGMIGVRKVFCCHSPRDLPVEQLHREVAAAALRARRVGVVVVGEALARLPAHAGLVLVVLDRLVHRREPLVAVGLAAVAHRRGTRRSGGLPRCESSRPSFAMWRLAGTNTSPPPKAERPPSFGAFSSSAQRRPRSCATIAAEVAPRPEPTQTRSTSRSHFAGFAAIADLPSRPDRIRTERIVS